MRKCVYLLPLLSSPLRPHPPYSDDYTKAATIQGTKLNELNDMATTLQEAFRAYKETCPEDAARCLSQAIDHYLDEGNFRRAAKQKEELAELYEKIGDKSNARSAYEVAAQWYESDNAPQIANKLNLKAAELAALDCDYLDATRRFERAATYSVGDKLTHYSTKKYLLQAGLCHLALDVIGAKRALESYRELDSQFPSTEEYKFLAGLLDPVEQGDSDAFKEVVQQYYGYRREPDAWHTAICTRWVSRFKLQFIAKCGLYRIHKQLDEKEEDFS